MGQDLRVAGWLRFGNQAQLAKGLRAFAADSPSEYFDETSWDVVGLDATIRLEVELPGDFTNVERPFMEMVKAASAGYVDYFEDGKKHVAGNWPIARWAVHLIDKKKKYLFGVAGNAGVPYAEAGKPIQLSGTLTFDKEKSLAQAFGEGGLFRLPFLAKDGIQEIRLTPEQFKRGGESLTADLTVAVDARVIEGPVIEVARALSQKAAGGSLEVHGGDRPSSILPKAKRKVGKWGTSSMQERGTRVEAVGAREPLPVVAPPPAASPKKKAPEKGSTLLAPATPTKGAQLLSNRRLVTWSEQSVAIWDMPLAAPAWSIKLHVDGDSDFGWPILGITEITPTKIAVFHEMNGDVDFVDFERKERKEVPIHGHSVYGVRRLSDRLVSWSLDRSVRTFTFDGEPITTISTGVDSAVDDIHVEAEEKVLIRTGDLLFVHDLKTGEKLAELGACSALHSLPKGRHLVVRDQRCELREGDTTLCSCEVQSLFGSQVAIAGDDRYFFYGTSGRQVTELVLRDGSWSARAIATKHTSDLGGFVPLGEGLFASHGRTLPGLEKYGFDGNVRIWNDALEPIGEVDVRAPIKTAIPLPGARVAVVMQDAVRGKELVVIDAAKTKLTATLKGSKKQVIGALFIPDSGLLVWSADKTTRLYEV